MMSTKDRSEEDSFSGFKPSKDCTPQELEEQLRKIDERFGGRDNAKKFLEGMKEMNTPFELLEAWNQSKKERCHSRKDHSCRHFRILGFVAYLPQTQEMVARKGDDRVD